MTMHFCSRQRYHACNRGAKAETGLVAAVCEDADPLPIVAEEYRDRVARVRAELERTGFDALVAFANTEQPGPVSYLTGYSPIFEHAWCVVTATSVDLVAGPFEHRRFDGGTWLDRAQVRRANNHVEEVDRLLGSAQRVALAGTFTLPAWAERSLAATGDRTLEPSPILDELRAIKSPAELDAMRAAVRVTDAGTLACREATRAGANEIEIASAIEVAMRREGLERILFPPAFGSGERSLDVTILPADRVLEPGDMLMLDLSARHHGYCGDMARGIVAGEPSAEQLRMLEAVLAMYEAGLQRLRPGVDVRAPHRVCGEVARDHGYEYLHETGHGIGADLHEWPSIDEGDFEIAFAAGMVVCIEPGLYYPGIGGCRIENTIEITEAGPIELNHVRKDLWATW
jgi:Xaa-Pro aminopeptidase